MSFQSMNLVSASMFLLVFFVSEALTDECPERSALFISAPQRIEALSGSCLQIACNFSAKDETEFDSERETFGLWIKETITGNPQPTVVFNSSGSVVKYPIIITGNLKEKNCTTLFSNLNTIFTGTYYFRIMNWPYRATSVCDPLQITVKDSPPSPRIEISGDLKENQSVTVTCSALTPCPRWPPKLTWNLQKDSHNHMEQNTDGSFTTKIQESITLSEQHDGYNISCSAAYPVNEGEEKKTAEETRTLKVSYAPKNTSVSISPSGLVSAGTKVNLSCSSRAKPPVSSFTWFKISNNTPPMNVSEGEFYSFNVTADGFYYCEARNEVGHQKSSSLFLRTEDSPPRPRIEISGDLKENQSVTVTCSALTPCPRWPPKLTLNLQKDSHNLMEQNTDGSFTTKIQESITLSEQHDGYNISCSASYPVNEGEEEKTAEETRTLRVSYAPKNTSVSISPSGLVSAGTKVNLTCSCSRAKPPVSSFTWFKISNNRPPMSVSEGEFYSFNVTTDGVYYCEARNEVGHQKSSSIHLRIGEHSDLSLLWGSAIGGIIVITSQRDDELTQQPADESEETIHYGEINFSVRRPELHSVLVQDCGLGQDSLYAQVKESKPARSRTQSDDSPQTLYATVKTN
ncbi:vascular cell adhesion protein 1-like [Halichoeres trimaculatus]|uniref:vascular cell adhesion protein 1-like n=1 Tax=Halichoeres trimaculatus TaxID=147232 RepID=UPI003D9E00C5